MPDRNIIVKVTRFPTTAEDSTLLDPVPTGISGETNMRGPTARNGTIQRVSVMCAPNTKIPTRVMRTNEIIVRAISNVPQ